ncbi:MP domain-containing protein [Melia azedarach]|uniref:MP domain-containing protein n=1 Tax=Melia azedarach TaxID=155640 RepID=A0ACC1XEZ1_MELAZ|nr:MP domain-containing protein [Melia azedarach]
MKYIKQAFSISKKTIPSKPLREWFYCITSKNLFNYFIHLPWKHLRSYRKFKFLHLGLVQVGIKPLTREIRDASVLLCLRDGRFLNFNDSLLSVLESRLAEGPVHFNYFPNFMVYLQDKNISSVLKLNVKFENLEMEDTSFPFLLMYRICCKCMPNSGNPAAKKSSPTDRTTFYQRLIRTQDKIVSRTIIWRDVQFPEEWKIREVPTSGDTSI